MDINSREWLSFCIIHYGVLGRGTKSLDWSSRYHDHDSTLWSRLTCPIFLRSVHTQDLNEDNL
jgi:hypothetical protein